MIKRILFIVAAAAAVALAAALPAAGQAGSRLVEVGSFDSPVYVADAPGQKRLLFVVEQAGTIELLRDERDLARPFLDISELVSSGGERGLLSVAFAPDYRRSRSFYVYFTNSDGDIEVDEFKRSKGSPARALEGSRRVLLVINHRQASNHNGGQLQFGPDDLLYIGTGDGGGAGDGFDNARDTESLLGKLLRIDPRPPQPGTGAPKLGYRIPADNPFVGSAGADEIFAYGLRNPWRFSFDGQTLAIGDVGQGAFEEVDMLGAREARGANFGWPQFEGTHGFDASRPGAGPPIPPVFEYSHDGGACSITGGYIVRDPGLPSLASRYIYGDYCRGELRSFEPVAQGSATGDAPVGLEVPSLSSFGEGVHGQIYAVSQTGPVYRLEQ